LFLEESSAERIIRDYLVPWFAPTMSRVRILAASGADDVEPSFQEFHRMIRFTHLQPAYKNAAWVLVDGDEKGQRIVERMRATYSIWDADRFRFLSKPQFELYFPVEFAADVSQVLSIADKRLRRERKRELLYRGMSWLSEDADRGRDSLQKSAAEVIEFLRGIVRELAESNPEAKATVDLESHQN
jgi:hypothetical protein